MIEAGLRDVLGGYPAADRPCGTVTALGGGGGLSGSLLWRYRSANGDRLLRAHPPGARGIGRIHLWIARLRGLDYVPQPVATLAGGTTLGHDGRTWSLEPWLPGVADLGAPPGVEHVRAAFAALAEVHHRLASGDEVSMPSPGLSLRSRSLRRLLEGGFEELDRAIAGEAGDPLAPLASRWLDRARGIAPAALAILDEARGWSFSLQPCLRDARPEHFLFVGSSLTAIVDFGAMDLDTVAVDLARLMGEWIPRGLHEGLRAEGLDAYRAVRRLRDSELAAAHAFEAAADVLIGESWARWRFLEHRAFDGRAFEEGLARGVGRAREGPIITWT